MIFVALHSMWAGGPYRPEDLIVDEFVSTVPGENFDMCIISTRTKTHYNPLEKFNINIGVPLPNSLPSGLVVVSDTRSVIDFDFE